MSQKKPRALQKRNRTGVIGALNAGTFTGTEAAVRAAIGWGVAAHAAGRSLADLAVLLDKQDPQAVKATLALRHYWKQIAPQDTAADIRARLEQPDAPDTLLLLVAHDDCDSSITLTLEQMKEAHFGG